MHRVDGTLEKQHREQQKAWDRLTSEVRSLGEQLASPPWQDDLAEMRLILNDIRTLLQEAEMIRDDIRTLLQEAESDRRAKEL